MIISKLAVTLASPVINAGRISLEWFKQYDKRKFRVRSDVLFFIVFLILFFDVEAIESNIWEMINPAGIDYEDEPVRMKLKIPEDIKEDSHRLLEDGVEIPWQLEKIDGEVFIWGCINLKTNERHRYELVKGKPAEFPYRVKVIKDGNLYILDNNFIAVCVPSEVPEGKVIPPLIKFRFPDGTWAGSSFWKTERRLINFKSELIGNGKLFAKLRLYYEFEGTGGLFNEEPATYQVDITLYGHRYHAVIEEKFAMGRDEYWEIDIASGWKPNEGMCGFRTRDLGFGTADLVELKAGVTRMYDTLINLIPRWSQAFDDDRFFLARDSRFVAGAITCRAGKWLWPHDSMIEVKVKETGDYCGLRCPVRRGKRYWYFVAAPIDLFKTKREVESYVFRHAVYGLDKLHSEYILSWPGLKSDAKVDFDYGDGAGRFCKRNMAYPGWGPSSCRWEEEDHPVKTLTRIQNAIDPDTYGNHWLYYSPENPNFFSSWVNRMVEGVERLTNHPNFKVIKQLVEQKVREELYFGITMPGGAGQECFGYMARNSWRWHVDKCKKIGCDMSDVEPMLKAAELYIFKTSHPVVGGGRRSHPGGDTHPPGPDPFEALKSSGETLDLKSLKTEEFPGFGVVFRNRCGSPQETYLAFKSGPNRGHFHGDQLSFHYCCYARPQIVDHHCSYRPRAGQEHMHNRVAFHSDNLPYANMDGYERLIAFKTSDEVDIAIGQVESERLRVTTKFPPEEWDIYLPQEELKPPLKYRRTIVFLKRDKQDYFVVRDQFSGPELYATYCLHVYGKKCERNNNIFDFDPVRVVAVEPANFKFERHDWSHTNGGLEETVGLRLTVRTNSGEFITVIMPRDVKRADILRLVVKDGVRVDKREKKEKNPRWIDFDVVVLLTYYKDKWAEEIKFLLPSFHSGIICDGKLQVNKDDDKYKEFRVYGKISSRGISVDLDYNIFLDRKSEDIIEGSYKGLLTINPEKNPFKVEKEGTVNGTIERGGPSPLYDFEETEFPVVERIVDGVRVGNDEVRFKGGIDDIQDIVYVSVLRNGEEIIKLTGEDINMERFQGDIGLFVPDAGYPFGDIPDWLLRQRLKKPAWYKELWPPARYVGSN